MIEKPLNFTLISVIERKFKFSRGKVYFPCLVADNLFFAIECARNVFPDYNIIPL